MLFETKATDPMVVAAAAAFLMVLGVAAGFFPAKRASKLDPMTALRWE